MSTSVGSTYQGSPFPVHWAANDNLKDLHPVKLHLIDQGELPESPGSACIMVHELKDAWLHPAKHAVTVKMREWCTAVLGPESTTSWRLMTSGFVFFAHRSDAVMFWVAWHQVEITV